MCSCFCRSIKSTWYDSLRYDSLHRHTNRETIAHSICFRCKSRFVCTPHTLVPACEIAPPDYLVFFPFFLGVFPSRRSASAWPSRLTCSNSFVRLSKFSPQTLHCSGNLKLSVTRGATTTKRKRTRHGRKSSGPTPKIPTRQTPVESSQQGGEFNKIWCEGNSPQSCSSIRLREPSLRPHGLCASPALTTPLLWNLPLLLRHPLV